MRSLAETLVLPLLNTFHHSLQTEGFARRYFTLTGGGVLAYAFEPGQPQRDQLLLSQAAISTARGRKDIHVDSRTGTFHIRCLTMDDFEMWMGAFR